MSDGILGVVLAGGLATRMGGSDKGLLRLGQQTILDEVLERLHPQVDEAVLNVNGDAERFASFGLPCICLLYTSPSPRDLSTSRMPSSA